MNERIGHLGINQDKLYKSNENMEAKISSKVNPVEGIWLFKAMILFCYHLHKKSSTPFW